MLESEFGDQRRSFHNITKLKLSHENKTESNILYDEATLLFTIRNNKK